MNDGSNAAIGVSGQERHARLQVRAPLREIEHAAVGRDERQLPDHRQRQVDAVVNRVLEREREIEGLVEPIRRGLDDQRDGPKSARGPSLSQVRD